MTDLTACIEDAGFAVVAHRLDDAQVTELVETMSNAVRMDDVRVPRSRRRGTVYAMRNLLAIEAVRRLAGSQAVLGLVRPILGDGAFPVRAIYFDKTRDANWKVPWHQDLAIAVRERRDIPGFGPWSVKAGVVHVQPPAPVLQQMLTVRVHLDPTDEANGPLRVLPGSHRLGVVPTVEIGRLHASMAEVTCLVPRGAALLMRPLLVHASSEARDDAHRRVIHVEYAAGDLPGGLEWWEHSPVHA
ncbi:MAG: hypothetical protein QOF51_2314 [Chloroflexota bacterium]|nr:hypothetical protein [Chloroflexota bacterium]